MTTFPSFPSQVAQIRPVVQTPDFKRHQHRYTATSFPSSIPNNSYSKTTTSSPISLTELKIIEAELKGVVLNPCDDEDADELDPSEIVTAEDVLGEIHGRECDELADTDTGYALASGLTCNASEDVGASMTGSTPQIVSCKLSGASATLTASSQSRPDFLKIDLKHIDTVGSFSSLNRTDLSELQRHEHLLNICQKNYLSSIRNKVRFFPQRFPDMNYYLRQASLMVLTNGWSSVDRFCRCCIPNKRNPSGECRLHRFCPYCSWRAGQSVALRYVPAFDDGTWHFLTGSYTGELTMNGPADAHDWLCYWDAYKLALNKLVEDGDVRGVFWTEELAVNSMLPIKVLPHVHAIVEASEITKDTVAKLQQLVSNHLNSNFDEPLAPNIKVQGIKTQRSLFHHLRYMFKPINVLKAYDLAWTRALHNHRGLAQPLNSQTTDLVLGYAHETTMRLKMNAKGNLDGRTKNFIGIRKKNYEQHRETLTRIMEQPLEYIEMNDPETTITGQL